MTQRQLTVYKLESGDHTETNVPTGKSVGDTFPGFRGIKCQCTFTVRVVGYDGTEPILYGVASGNNICRIHKSKR